MPGHHPVVPGRTPTKECSDLDDIRAWWRTLGGEGFVALVPPTRSRYTQSDGHEDAAELFGARGLGADTSFAYWHWQSHQAFDRAGALTGELTLHWGGDYAVVAARLGSGPTGYQVIDRRCRGAAERRARHRTGTRSAHQRRRVQELPAGLRRQRRLPASAPPVASGPAARLAPVPSRPRLRRPVRRGPGADGLGRWRHGRMPSPAPA